jgi:hypothetical protein
MRVEGARNPRVRSRIWGQGPISVPGWQFEHPLPSPHAREPARIIMRSAFLALLIFVTAVRSSAYAETAQSAPAVSSHLSEEDITGTNPAKFTRTLILFNEFRSLGNEAAFNEAMFRYVQPVGKNLKVQLSLPLDATDAAGDTAFGFGELSLKFNYRAWINEKNALIINLDTFWPTATRDEFMSGKYVVDPGVTYAMFLKHGEMIFAPSLQQKISYAGDADRDDVNQTQVDLYFVWRPNKTNWVTIDPQIVRDWEKDTEFGQLEIEFGRVMFGGMSVYVRPGIGIGADRPLDWNLELGLKVVH